MKKCSPKADEIICSVAEAQALKKVNKMGGIVKAQKCDPIFTWTKGQRVGTYLYSFKVIVLLPQTKVPPRFRSEFCSLKVVVNKCD